MENTVKKIMLTLQYDGTAFHGFQRQKDGLRTVQGETEIALSQLLGQPVETAGAARTDAGVHALGQVVSFSAQTVIPANKIAHAIRPLLPDDLQAVSSREVPEDFNARFSALGKEYRYVFYHAPAPVPFLRPHAYHLHRRPDVEAMRRALKLLEGEKDFSCFRNEGSIKTIPIRRITKTGIVENGFFIIVRVSGSGFLYKMVRNIAGTVLDAGLGRMDAEKMTEIIESKDRTQAGQTLPPHGLYLVKVDYDLPEIPD